MKTYSKKTSLLLFLMVSIIAPNAHAIKKCKDAEGNWHYGDLAEQLCAKSKITTLTKSGFIKETQEAPKTAEELQAEAELKEEELAAAELKRQKDEERDRILSIYEQEEDIDRQRDNQLASVDSNIRVHQAYLKQMDVKIKRLEQKSAASFGPQKEKIDTEILGSKSRVSEFTTELKRLEEQKKSIMSRFDQEKKLYRQYQEE